MSMLNERRKWDNICEIRNSILNEAGCMEHEAGII